MNSHDVGTSRELKRSFTKSLLVVKPLFPPLMNSGCVKSMSTSTFEAPCCVNVTLLLFSNNVGKSVRRLQARPLLLLFAMLFSMLQLCVQT